MYSLIRAAKHAWIALLLVPSLALAQPPTLSNSQEPGSLMVFPYFKKGTVNNGKVLDQTVIHIGVTCPTGVICPENEPIKLDAQWVCPGSERPSTSFVCRETNFVLFTTVNGKITLDPNGFSTVGHIPVPPCPEGYLLVFVVNLADQPIKFDGLIGDAVIRLNAAAESAYNGVPVQAANTEAAVGTRITEGTNKFRRPTLILDGLNNDYALVTGQLSGDVKFDNTTVSPVYNNTFLVLLTVDVQSNFPNNPTFVDLTFYNATQSPTSTTADFVCWQKVDITDLSASLDQTSQGTVEGSFVSDQALKVAIEGIDDFEGPVTLLGLVITTENSKPNGVSREYITAPFNNSIGVATVFSLD
jgi:hypothetical protein